MIEDVRKYVRAGIEALAPQGTEDLAATLLGRAQTAAEQLSSFASGFLEWSAEARASLLKEVRDLVARQIQEMGLATKADVETLRRRIDRLEAGGPQAQRGRASAVPSGARAKAGTAGRAKASTAAPAKAASGGRSKASSRRKSTAGSGSGARRPRRAE